MTEGWEIETATTLEEIERLRDVWQGIQLHEPFPQINADHDRFVSLLKSKGEGVQPHVMLIKNNGQLITIVAGWIKTLRIDFQTHSLPPFGVVTLENRDAFFHVKPERESWAA